MWMEGAKGTDWREGEEKDRVDKGELKMWPWAPSDLRKALPTCLTITMIILGCIKTCQLYTGHALHEYLQRSHH